MLSDVGNRAFRIENLVSAAVGGICGVERVFFARKLSRFLYFVYFVYLSICLFCIFLSVPTHRQVGYNKQKSACKNFASAFDAERTSSPDAKEGTRSFDRSVLLTDEVLDSMK